jgi:hypothetical protein
MIYHVCELGVNYTFFVTLLTSGIDILNHTGIPDTIKAFLKYPVILSVPDRSRVNNKQ